MKHVRTKFKIPKTFKKLFLYQKKGLRFLLKRDGNGLIADEMGLGKTVQALAYIATTKRLPVLIICPASLKYNWVNEIKKWAKFLTWEVLSGRKPYPLTKRNVVIINYDILSYWSDFLTTNYHFEVVVCDESHYFKNDVAKRTVAVKEIQQQYPRFIALTGTPIESKPIEIFNVLNMLSPEYFGSFTFFVKRYCAPKKKRYGWDYSGASNLKELNRRIEKSGVMLRRRKNEVIELPDKLYDFQEIPISNTKEYREAENNFIQYVRTVKGDKAAKKASAAQILVKNGYLKRIAAIGKVSWIVEWIKTFMETSQQKLVLFAIHKAVIAELYSKFKNISVVIDGSVPTKKRHLIVQRFQNDPNIRMFIGNIRAAGEGLTLTAASHVAFIELPDVPGKLAQAIDRVHRIGAVNKVTVHFFLAEDSIEYRVATSLHKKILMIEKIVDGGGSFDVNDDDVSMFYKIIK
jgi:SWI/SNF-related matrix-associated actin-dependent regulator 1 of chromatin subfamily A